MTNPTCASCPKSYETINGRYCSQLRCYVEYCKDKAPCEKEKK